MFSLLSPLRRVLFTACLDQSVSLLAGLQDTVTLITLSLSSVPKGVLEVSTLGSVQDLCNQACRIPAHASIISLMEEESVT